MAHILASKNLESRGAGLDIDSSRTSLATAIALEEGQGLGNDKLGKWTSFKWERRFFLVCTIFICAWRCLSEVC